jgi:hypothetical protein
VSLTDVLTRRVLARLTEMKPGSWTSAARQGVDHRLVNVLETPAN